MTLARSIGPAVAFLVGVATATALSQGPAPSSSPTAQGQRDATPVPAPAGPDMNAHYALGPDSQAQDGVPKGEVKGPYVLPSQAYPGTQHTYWVYVPAQYDAAAPASLMVFQDGQAFKDRDAGLRTPNILDNLIYRREIPVMLAVFINPGRTPEQPEPNAQEWGDRTTNRPDRIQHPRRQVRAGRRRRTAAGPEEGVTPSRAIRSSAASAARVPARLRRSRSPGSGRTNFAECSALLGASSTCAAATRTQTW